MPTWISPSRYWMGLKGPVYRPEHWDKVQELDMWTNKFDPIMTCQPMGIPRQGEPRRIFQLVLREGLVLLTVGLGE